MLYTQNTNYEARLAALSLTQLWAERAEIAALTTRPGSFDSERRAYWLPRYDFAILCAKPVNGRCDIYE